MEAATWNGPNIHRTSQVLGLRSEASGRFEKGLAPEQAMEAQAVATRLMIELTRRAPRAAGRSTSAAPARPGTSIRLREQRVAGLLGAPIPRAAPGRDPARARLRRRGGAATASTSPCPPSGATTSRARPTSIEEVARIDGLEKLPATLPTRRGSAGRLTPEQRLRRRAEDALVGRGLYEVVGWSFTEPGARRPAAPGPPTTRAGAFVALENPMCEDAVGPAHRRCSARCSTPRATTSRAAGPTCALFEAGAVYRRRRRASCPHEHRSLGRRARRPPAPAVVARRRSRRAADFFAAKGVLGAVLDALRVRWDVEPATEPFLHPGRSARVLAGGEDVGLARRAAPARRRARGTSTHGAASSSSTSTASLGHADAVPHYDDLTSFPALRQDLAVVVADDVAGRDACWRSCARRAASCCADVARLRRLPRRAGGGGAQSLALRARVPRARPHADRRGRRAACASASSPRCATSWGASCVASVDRRRRRRATPARSPPRCWTATRASSSRRSRAARTPARASTTSTRATACR